MNLKQLIIGKRGKFLSVARELNTSASTLSLWANGWARPNEKQQKKLAEVLGVTNQEIEIAVRNTAKREGQ